MKEVISSDFSNYLSMNSTTTSLFLFDIFQLFSYTIPVSVYENKVATCNQNILNLQFEKIVIIKTGFVRRLKPPYTYRVYSPVRCTESSCIFCQVACRSPRLAHTKTYTEWLFRRTCQVYTPNGILVVYQN